MSATGIQTDPLVGRRRAGAWAIIWGMLLGGAGGLVMAAQPIAQNPPSGSLPPRLPRSIWPMGVFSQPFGVAGKKSQAQPEAEASAPSLTEPLVPRASDLPPDAPPAQAPVITAVALERGSRLFATGGDDHLIRLWELPEGRLRQRLEGHRGWVRTAAFSPDGQHLATAGDDRCVVLFRVAQAEPVWKTELGAAIYALAFSPDGRRLAAAGFSDKIWLLDSTTGNQIAVWAAPGEDVRAVAFSPDGGQLAAGSRNGLVRLCSTANGVRQHDLAAHQRRVRTLAYSPDGQWLVSGGDDGRVVACNPATGQNARLVAQLPGAVYVVTFCGPDRLAVGGTDNQIRLIRLSDGRLLRELAGHTGTVAALGWQSDTQTLISGGFDTTVRFWPLGPPENPPTEPLFSTREEPSPAMSPFAAPLGDISRQPVGDLFHPEPLRPFSTP